MNGLTCAERWLAAATLLLCAALNVQAQQTSRYAEANDAYKKCNELYSQRNYAEAGKAFESFARTYIGHPSRDAAFYMAASSYGAAGQVDDSLRIAAEHEKTFPRTTHCLNSIRAAGQALYAARKYEQAAAMFERLLDDTSYADRYSVWYMAHLCFFSQKQYDKCIVLCDRFVQKYPGYIPRVAEVLLRKMECLSQLGRDVELESAAQEIEKIAPNTVFSATAWEKTGSAEYNKLKRYRNACEAYRKAALTPGYTGADGCMRMACTAAEQIQPRDYQLTIAVYEEFTKNFADTPNDWYARIRLANAYGVGLKDTKNEMRILQECEQLYGKTAVAPEILAAILNVHSRDKAFLGEARKSAVRLTEEWPDTPQSEYALYWLADLYKRNNEKLRAREYLEKLIAKFPAGQYTERAQEMMKDLK